MGTPPFSGPPGPYKQISSSGVNNNFGPNIVGGNSGNFIDPAYSSSVISGGGRNGYENKLLHTSGQVTGTDFSVIAGGYDNIGTDIWPGVMAGAHNRINTAIVTSPINGNQTPGLFAGIAGAGTITSSGTAVTGVGTAFTTFLKIGSAIYTNAGSNYQIVATITDDTHLTTVAAFSPSVTTSAYIRTNYYVPNFSYIANANTDHSAIPCGTFHAIYNAHMGAIVGGTQNTIGWDGTTNVGGDYSFIGGGYQNICNSSYSFIGSGFNNYIRAQYCFVSGYNNQILNSASTYSAIFGQTNSTGSSGNFIAGINNSIGTSSNFSAIFGQSNSSAATRQLIAGVNHSGAVGSDNGTMFGNGCRINKSSQQSISGGLFATKGDSQSSSVIGRAHTVDATPINLSLDGTTSGTTGLLFVGSTTSSNYTAVACTIKIVAQIKTALDAATWTFDILVQRGANAAATQIVQLGVVGNVASTAPNNYSTVAAGLWRVALLADTTNGALQIQCTGAVTTDIRWTAEVRMPEVNNP